MNGIEMIDSSSNSVLNDYIGTDVSGRNPLGNQNNGVLIGTDGAIGNNGQPIPSSQNTIGGLTGLNSTRNVISDNGANNNNLISCGVQIEGATSNQNVVEGDYIGMGVDGTTPLGNGADGVLIWNQANGNFVGGAQAGAGNLISDNGVAPQALNNGWGYGVSLSSNNNLVEQNTIGLDINGNIVANKNNWQQDAGNGNQWVNNTHN